MTLVLIQDTSCRDDAIARPLPGPFARALAAIGSVVATAVRARYLSIGLIGRTVGAEMIAPRLYRLLRYPLYLGPVLALWSTPIMTAGRLLLAAGATLHSALCIWWEERCLPPRFGGLSWRGR